MSFAFERISVHRQKHLLLIKKATEEPEKVIRLLSL